MSLIASSISVGIFGTWYIFPGWAGKFALRPIVDSEEAYDEIEELVPVVGP